jgi:hypothetical protein
MQLRLAAAAVMVAGIGVGTVGAQTSSVTIEAFIDGRSRAIVQDATIRWQHLDFERPGRWNGGNHPTYLTVRQGKTVELPRFAWLPVWIANGNNSEPIGLGEGPFGSECDPAALRIQQARGIVEIIQQPTIANGLTTIVEFNDNQPLAAAWYIVEVTWDLPRCPADFNCDEAVNSQDFFAFLAAFFVNGPSADFNRDDRVNSQDFFDFVAAFFEIC